MISVRKARDVNVPIEDCYGWVTSCGVHFISNDGTAVTSFWEPDDAITVELLDKHYDTLTDIIKHTSICTTDEVIRVLDSVGSFTVEA